MAGIYLHIPFCKSRCKYCDFFSTTHLEKQISYVDALLTEWKDRKHEIKTPIKTIYIGGGTPSTLPIEQLQNIVSCLDNDLSHLQLRSKDIEITLEANPGDITLDKAKAWSDLGINRLSIGIQSFDDQLLTIIGRRHNAEQARNAVAAAQAAGFDNISIDLMYALPSQTMQQWQYDVEQAIQLGVQHISSYGLIYEDGTVLTTLLEHGVIEAIDEDLELEMYDYLVEQLTTNGFIHYEVSNFAQEGRESKHNSSYWNDIPYLGMGAGAHSYNGYQRQWNISDLDSYIKQALAHNLQPEIETLTEEQHRTEKVMLGLRTNRGINLSMVNNQAAEKFIQQGLLVQQNEQLIATTKGYHILNRIIEELL